MFLEVAEVVSNCIVASLFLSLLLLCAILAIAGLPKKAPQDATVKAGCSRASAIFLGMVYTFTYFTTDQYVPSLPLMGRDLSGSQSMMSATVQMNFVVKALAGIFTAGLSDRVGRRPTLLVCMVLLSLASFCCGCAGRIEWFFAARVLQGLGESVEPVVFAIVRDFFTEEEARFAMVAALQTVSIGGMLVAPVFGGFLAELFGWRLSFFVLAVVWGILAFYAYVEMVESCPDGSATQSYVSELKRLLDPYLLCLLLTESCMMAAYLTFNANISYLIQSFQQPTITASISMLTFAALNATGLWLMKKLQLGNLWEVAIIAVAYFASTGFVSLSLGILFSDFLWSYLLGTFLQASAITMALVSVNVLFFEPLQDCAGMAASCEICAKSLIPCFFSMLSTQSLMHWGPKGLTLFQASACISSGLVFCGSAWCNKPNNMKQQQ